MKAYEVIGAAVQERIMRRKLQRRFKTWKGRRA